MKETVCKSCGKKILFAKDVEGKTHPLDLVAPVFEVEESDSGPIARRAERSYVSHFANCPNSSGHSKSGSGAAPPAKNQSKAIAKPGTVYAWGGECFNQRETLKKWGFRWESDHKRWWLRVEDDRIDQCVAAVRRICPSAAVETGSGVK